MRTDYKRLVLGATFAGLGAAARSPKDCLVVERRAQPGYEYTGSFSTVPCRHMERGTAAQMLEQRLRRHGILSEDGKTAHGALSAFLHAYVLEQPYDILLMTEVEAVSAKDGRYEAVLVNASGVQRVTADEVFYAAPPKYAGDAYMSAVLAPPLAGAACPAPWQEGMAVEPGYFAGQYILKVRVDGDCSMQQARRALLSCWENRPPACRKWKIAAFAQELDWFYGRKDAPDFLTAFDGAVPAPVDRPNRIKEKSYDLIVAGLGTTGAVAAVTAARMGLSVLGLEQLSAMGGTSTAGAICGYYFGSKGGMYESLDGQISNLQKTDFSFRAPAKEIVLERAALEAGAELLYHASVIDVLRENGRVSGVRAVTDDAVYEVRTRYVLDCTGDGSVCMCAGCSHTSGRRADGQAQPYTRLAVRQNADKVYGTANVDFGRVDVDDAQDITRHLLASGARFMSDVRQDDSDYTLLLSPMLGIREGRLIACEHMLSAADLFDGKESPEPLFYAYADLDRHGWDLAFEDEELCDWAVAANLGAVNVTAAVPLGSMLPKGADGLLVAGRCMGMDHVMASCVRMQRDMQKAGEAVAAAAALAVRHHVPVSAVPYSELAALLRASGCLDEANHAGFVFDAPQKHIVPRPVTWLTDEKEIRRGLSSNCPGVAIWSCKRLGDTAAGWLECWLEDEDGNLRRHSAIALALLGSPAGEDVLLDMVRARDVFQPQDCRKHNQLRGVMAIYALRRLKSRRAVPELAAIVSGGAQEFARPAYQANPLTTRYQIDGYHDIYFQFLSHAVSALLAIRQAHPDEKEKIDTALHAFLNDQAYVERMVPDASRACEVDMAKNIARVVRRAIGEPGIKK